MLETVPMKRCSKCGEEKPATLEFFQRRPLGVSPDCKICINARVSKCRAAQKSSTYVKRSYQQTNPNWNEAPTQACMRCGGFAKATPEFFTRGRSGVSSMCLFCAQRKSEPVSEGLKRCAYCFEALPFAEFYKATHKKDGHNPGCRRCTSRRAHSKYHQNPEIGRAWAKKWREDNPEKQRANSNNARARRDAAPGEFTSQDIFLAFKVQKGCCLYCDARVGRGKGRSRWAVDHFIPLARGGTNKPSNIVIACQECNGRKWAHMPWQFMPERFRPPADVQAGHEGVECV